MHATHERLGEPVTAVNVTVCWPALNVRVLPEAYSVVPPSSSQCAPALTAGLGVIVTVSVPVLLDELDPQPATSNANIAASAPASPINLCMVCFPVPALR